MTKSMVLGLLVVGVVLAGGALTKSSFADVATVTTALDSLKSSVDSLAGSAFIDADKVEQVKHDLGKKIDEAKMNVSDGDYGHAIDVLDNLQKKISDRISEASAGSLNSEIGSIITQIGQL